MTVRRLRTAILFLVIITTVGTLGYVLIEGVSWFDAYYMAIITLASVGYGEVFPMSTAGRLFTTILIISNLGLFTYAISTIAHVFAEGGFSKLVLEYFMLERIQKFKGHTIICGYGRHAKEVTQELSKQGIQFVVIENSPDKIHELSEARFSYIEGDATEDAILNEAGIERAASLVITLPDDSDNIFIVISARQINPKIRIICRATNQADEAKLLRAGADHVVMPERIGGFYMATLVNKPDLVEFFNLISNMGPANVVFEELAVKDLMGKYQGRSIQDSQIVTECRIPVVAVRHPNGQYELNPPPSTPLQPDTHIVVFGNPEQMKKFREMALAKPT
ncbi:MAG: potassium channel protein [Saprospiraceae bacterium]|nr:potassium channel protein [Saprospiraceae bacterium]